MNRDEIRTVLASPALTRVVAATAADAVGSDDTDDLGDES